MLNNKSAFKYETPNKEPFEIKQCCTNETIILQYYAIKIRYNICHIKPYTSDTNIEDTIAENNVR